MDPTRSYLCGVEPIAEALHAGAEVRVLLVDRDDHDQAIAALLALARARGVAIWLGSAGDLRRMGRGTGPERALAMVGPRPDVELPELLARPGAIWLLHRVSYPSNAGFAVRTAEVSGAQGVIIDAGFNHHERERIAHVSMGADRLLPVLYQGTESTLEAARTHGHRLIAIEDCGHTAPWDVDLTGSVVLVIGSEREGIGQALLAKCDAVVRIPMAGFVPSYNLQAAMSAVAAERLRQLACAQPATPPAPAR